MSDIIRAEFETLIFTFRGKKVMVDADLASLYAGFTALVPMFYVPPGPASPGR